MIWNSASDFFHMGGYGFYVWGSYAVTVALLVIEPLLAAQRRRKAVEHARDEAHAEVRQ
jgi:heme exporter protein D